MSEYTIVCVTMKIDATYYGIGDENKIHKESSFINAKKWIISNGLRITNEIFESNNRACYFFTYLEQDKNEWHDCYDFTSSYCFTQFCFDEIINHYNYTQYYLYLNVIFYKEDGSYIKDIPLEVREKNLLETYQKNSSSNIFYCEDSFNQILFSEAAEIYNIKKELLRYHFYTRNSMYDLTKIYIRLPKFIIKYMDENNITEFTNEQFKFLYNTTNVNSRGILNTGEHLFARFTSLGCNNIARHQQGLPMYKEILNICKQLYMLSDIENGKRVKVEENKIKEEKKQHKKEKKLKRKNQEVKDF